MNNIENYYDKKAINSNRRSNGLTNKATISSVDIENGLPRRTKR